MSWNTALPCVVALLLTLAPAASAHIVVLPEESDAGGWERYTVIVPTEKKSPTVRIELKLPNGIDVMGIESNGWEAVYEPFPIGAAKLRWTGGRIPAGQMVSFDFLVWNPKAPQTLRWDATQWYEDGSNDHWGDHDASQTVLRAANGARAHHHHDDDGDAADAHATAGSASAAPPAAATVPPARDAGAADETDAARAHAATGDTTDHHGGERHDDRLATVLALAALGISVAAFVVARRAHGTRDRVQ